MIQIIVILFWKVCNAIR